MNLLYGILLGLVAQTLTFIQLQGLYKWQWMKDKMWAVVLLGIPISVLFMFSVRFMVEHFDGQLWPSRLIGFAVGTIVFATLSIILFNEPITSKTWVCLFLAFCILLIQLFWK
jgi:hypothetical protein